MATMTAFVFLALCGALVTDAAPVGETVGHCLLSHRSLVRKREFSQQLETADASDLTMESESVLLEEQMETFMTKLKRWRKKHNAVEAAFTKAKGPFEDFIRANAVGSDKCSARLLEAKRVLDGITAKVHELSLQIKGHEETLSSETENLKIAQASIDQIELKYKREEEKCHADAEAAKEDVAKYKAELEELRQMANPDVKYDFNANDALTNTETSGGNNNEAGESFLETSSIPKNKKKKELLVLDQSQCKKFIAFQNRNSKDKKPSDRDCDKARDALQEEFSEAYRKIQELIIEAQERVDALDDCLESVQIRMNADLVPLISAREAASERIESASNSIAALSPTLDTLKSRLEKLRAHIEEMKGTCKDCDMVSEHLLKIRELIHSLEECPGRDDFKLKIPKANDDDNDNADNNVPDLGVGVNLGNNNDDEADENDDDETLGASADDNNNNNFNNNNFNNNDNNNNNEPEAPPVFCSEGVVFKSGGNELSGRGCCPLECGKCGGKGCSQRPGGKANCCVNEQGNRCTTLAGPPPCIYGGTKDHPEI